MQPITFDIHPFRWPLCKAAGLLTARVFSSALSGLRLNEVAEPALPTPRWIRLRTRLGGICGTDMATILLQSHPASFLRSLTSFPVGLGHEVVAEVAGGAGVPLDRMHTRARRIQAVWPTCWRCVKRSSILAGREKTVVRRCRRFRCPLPADSTRAGVGPAAGILRNHKGARA